MAVYGYALSGDGLWREHSWLLADKAVVETTESRLLYHGFVRTDDEAVIFALGQLPAEEVFPLLGEERTTPALETLRRFIKEAEQSA